MSKNPDNTPGAGPDIQPESQARQTGASRNIDDLPPAAQRALKEAEERRRAQDNSTAPAREIGGRGGKDPARYGDWEIDGRAVDF